MSSIWERIKVLGGKLVLNVPEFDYEKRYTGANSAILYDDH